MNKLKAIVEKEEKGKITQVSIDGQKYVRVEPEPKKADEIVYFNATINIGIKKEELTNAGYNEKNWHKYFELLVDGYIFKIPAEFIQLRGVSEPDVEDIADFENMRIFLKSQ